MLKTFTNEMIEEFNELMKNKESIIRLYLRENQVVDIKIVKDNYLNMEDQVINPSKEFYKDLESFFNGKEMSIHYNNIGSCFWSTSLK